MRRLIVFSLLVLCAAAPATANAFDPVAEQQNRSKERERDAIHQAPDYQVALEARSRTNAMEAASILAADPERIFSTSLCAT